MFTFKPLQVSKINSCAPNPCFFFLIFKDVRCTVILCLLEKELFKKWLKAQYYYDFDANDNEHMQRKSDFTERSEADVYST